MEGTEVMRTIRLSLPNQVCKHLRNGRARYIVVPKTKQLGGLGRGDLIDINSGRQGMTISKIKFYLDIETAFTRERPENFLAQCSAAQAIAFWKRRTPRHLKAGCVAVLKVR